MTTHPRARGVSLGLDWAGATKDPSFKTNFFPGKCLVIHRPRLLECADL